MRKALVIIFLCTVSIVGILFWTLAIGLPEPVVRYLSRKVQIDGYCLRVTGASWSPGGGLKLRGVKLFEQGSAAGAFLSASEIKAEFSLRPRIALQQRLKKLSITGLSFPELPPKGGAKGGKSIPELPAISPFQIVLENCNVLGIRAKRLSGVASVRGHVVSVRGIAIDWPEEILRDAIHAECTLDFEKRLVEANIEGKVLPHHITPLMSPQGVNAPEVIREVGKFTGIEEPLDAKSKLSIDIDSADFDIGIDLSLGKCSYNGTPLESVVGSLRACETGKTTTVEIHPLNITAKNGEGEGRVFYSDEDDRVVFTGNARMDLPKLFDIIGVLNDGELSAVKCDAPPVVEASGTVCTAKLMAGATTNDANGKVLLPLGSILNFPVKDTTADFRIRGYSAFFDNIHATPRRGGTLAGKIDFRFPDYSATQTVFRTELDFHGVDVQDVLHALHSTNSQMGRVSGRLSLSSFADTRALGSLSGSGHVDFSEGVITQIPLFAGFTAYMAKNIPGISAIVDQSSGSMDFTITNGVLYTESALLESSFFSLKGRGTYDLVNDRLDFIVRANIFRQKSIAGRIAHFVTFPFTKLLLEFKVFGPLENSDWAYVNIIEKITGG